MTLFRTVVEIPDNKEKLSYKTPSLWMGSCFTENIGSRLSNLKFPCMVNPFGVLYNPLSIMNSLLLLAEERLFSESDLYYGNELWYSFYHHSSFSHPEKSVCLSGINEGISSASKLLRDAKFLFITFGTARVYRLKETGFVVSNNHKLPHNNFDHSLLEVDEIVRSYKKLIEQLTSLNPVLSIVFTLSPVRHWKDGATGNQISKSTLMIAISKLVDSFYNVYYYPAYEIVMDELRDYRFYSDDMLHISSRGVDYIWTRFTETFFDQSVFRVVKEITAILRGLEHKPFNPSTDKHRQFLRMLLYRISSVERSLPESDFSDEKRIIRHLLGPDL